jgi:hypothetical protein
MPGVPDVYLEASYRGHKVSPGKYRITLKQGNATLSSDAEILANPLYSATAADYKEYDIIMSAMETELTAMHNMINNLAGKRIQLESLLASLKDEKYKQLVAEGWLLATKMKTWDGEMIQRKTKVYDDADNFPFGFTAHYIFLINQTESDIPKLTQPSLDRKKELDNKWAALKARGLDMLEKELSAFNKKCSEAGIGAVWK